MSRLPGYRECHCVRSGDSEAERLASHDAEHSATRNKIPLTAAFSLRYQKPLGI